MYDPNRKKINLEKGKKNDTPQQTERGKIDIKKSGASSSNAPQAPSAYESSEPKAVPQQSPQFSPQNRSSAPQPAPKNDNSSYQRLRRLFLPTLAAAISSPLSVSVSLSIQTLRRRSLMKQAEDRAQIQEVQAVQG